MVAKVVGKASYREEEDVFYAILDRLRKDIVFREAFFDNPERVLKHLENIDITQEEITQLANYEWTKVRRIKTQFDEKLLLCCSVGY